MDKRDVQHKMDKRDVQHKFMGRVVARTRKPSLSRWMSVHESTRKKKLVASLALTPSGSFGRFGFLLIRRFAAVSYGFSPVPCGCGLPTDSE
jgi:hypothetical protein